MKIPVCTNCEHPNPHNRWGRCTEDGCSCTDLTLGELIDVQTPEPEAPPSRPSPEEGPRTYVLRGPGGEPVAVPDAVITEADRIYKAYTMRQAGRSWEEIWEAEIGWESPAAVAASVQRYLADAAVLWTEMRRVEAIAMEASRYDALQAAVWDDAMKGKINHVLTAGKMIEKRVKLLKLDQVEDGDDGTVIPRTVVVRPEPEFYVHDLKAIVPPDPEPEEADEPEDPEP